MTNWLKCSILTKRLKKKETALYKGYIRFVPLRYSERGELIMSQTKQHFRGGCQTERPVQYSCKQDPGVYVTKESMKQFLDACRQEGRTAATGQQHLLIFMQYGDVN